MESSACIPANPDIAGIGVRMAIYTQALLILVPACLTVLKFAVNSQAPSIRNSEEFRNVKRWRLYVLAAEDLGELRLSMLPVQITGAALLISAAIQARLYGLSLYHAIIVINLSWLSNTTVATISAVELLLRHPETLVETFIADPVFALQAIQQRPADTLLAVLRTVRHGLQNIQNGEFEGFDNLMQPLEQLLHARDEGMRSSVSSPEAHPPASAQEVVQRQAAGWIGGLEDIIALIFPSLPHQYHPVTSLDYLSYALCSLHLIGIGIFGLLVFLHVEDFGNSAPCNDSIQYWVFGYHARTTSPQFRTACLAIFGMAVYPLANVVIEWLAMICAAYALILGVAIAGLGLSVGLLTIGLIVSAPAFVIVIAITRPSRLLPSHWMGPLKVFMTTCLNQSIAMVHGVLRLYLPATLPARSSQVAIPLPVDTNATIQQTGQSLAASSPSTLHADSPNVLKNTKLRIVGIGLAIFGLGLGFGLLTIIFIIGTERTISLNSQLVSDGEEDWTFGQTLAMLLLLPVMWDVCWKLYRARKLWRDQGSDEEQSRLLSGIEQEQHDVEAGAISPSEQHGRGHAARADRAPQGQRKSEDDPGPVHSGEEVEMVHRNQAP